jgi:hypothetical protein
MATHGEDVEVKFGASIEGLVAGCHQVEEAIAASPTPDHPEAGTDGAVEVINGPEMKPEYARGSVE